MSVDALNLLRRRKFGKGELKLPHITKFLVELSTDDAKLLLEAIDARQRGLRGRVVARYGRDMAGDRHKAITPILVSEGGTIFDGQHRLHAHAQMPSGKKIRYEVGFVPEQYEDAVRSIVDIGVARNAVDVAKLVGLDVPAVLVRAYLTEVGNGTASPVLSRAEVPDCIRSDKTSMRAAPFAARFKKTKVPQMAAFLRCARKDYDAAERFWGAVFAELPTVANDKGDRRFNQTANTVIRYLANVKGMHRAERKEVFNKCLYAWNCWRSDETLDKMPGRSIPTPPDVI